MKKRTFYLPIAFVLLWSIAATANNFFGIVEYSPQAFSEQVTRPFFFSIGNQLKFGNAIDANAPTLFKGASIFKARSFSKWLSVYPSPDGKKAAVANDGKLYIVEEGKPALLILESVDFISGKNIRVGEVFYEYPRLQWDSQSRYIYITKDKKKKSQFEQNYSRDGKLIRIDTINPAPEVEIISDFRANEYFLVGDEGVCFNYAPGNGKVIWKCSLNGKIQAVRQDGGNMVLQDGSHLKYKPFLSYSGDAGDIWLPYYGYSLKSLKGGYVALFSKLKPEAPILKIKGGTNIKGTFVDGVVTYRSAVLPGGRYALLDVLHDNFKGQLLVDGLTGQYRELPRDTRVYQNLNSWDYENVKFSITGTSWPRFLPIRKLRESE